MPDYNQFWYSLERSIDCWNYPSALLDTFCTEEESPIAICPTALSTLTLFHSVDCLQEVKIDAGARCSMRMLCAFSWAMWALQASLNNMRFPDSEVASILVVRSLPTEPCHCWCGCSKCLTSNALFKIVMVSPKGILLVASIAFVESCRDSCWSFSQTKEPQTWGISILMVNCCGVYCLMLRLSILSAMCV